MKTLWSNLNDPFQQDARGSINRYKNNGVKFNVLYTKAGALHSGDYHPVTQFDAIISGKWQITLRQKGKDYTLVKGPGEFLAIPPNTPHLFKCLADSVMVEWWDGPFEVSYYQPYRKLVERQFKKD